MDKKQFSALVKNQLKGNFFSNSPNLSVFLTPQVISNYYSFIQKHANDDHYKINYFNYVNEFVTLMFPSIESAYKKKKGISEEEVKRIQRLVRISLGQEYYLKIHGNEISLREKHLLCYYLFYFLDCGKKMYGFDFIHGQAEFLTDVCITAKAIEKVLETERQVLDIKNNISDYWQYSFEQLTDLSVKLFDNGFTHCNQCFIQGFEKKLDSHCNWEKGSPALFYLFWLLFNEQGIFPDPIFKHIISKFRFKGVTAKSKNLRTQYNQVAGNFQKDERALKAQILEVYTIYSSVFGKPK